MISYSTVVCYVPIDSYLEIAKRKLGSNETYPEIFDNRANEFASLINQLPKRRFGTVVEVGCGNAFLSTLWSLTADRVIAIDEEQKHLIQHSQGLECARKLIQCLDAKNVEVRPGKMENLPLPDHSADLLFSSYVLEHIMDLKPALTESCRVVKPGGLQIHIVPDFRDKVGAYWNSVRTGLRPKSFAKNLLRPFYKIVQGHWRALPNAIGQLPFLPPQAHDARKTFFQECWEYRGVWWKKQFASFGLQVLQTIDMPRKMSTAYVLKAPTSRLSANT